MARRRPPARCCCLPPVASYRKKFPKVFVHLVTNYTGDLAEMLADGRLDMALIFGAPSHDDLLSRSTPRYGRRACGTFTDPSSFRFCSSSAAMIRGSANPAKRLAVLGAMLELLEALEVSHG